LIAAKNEFNRLNSEYNDDVNKMSYFDDILADTIQRLEYECAEVHTSIVQLTLTKK
jgi:predicted HAD superfamily phosphohydrolase